jgi:hypothetical protein
LPDENSLRSPRPATVARHPSRITASANPTRNAAQRAESEKLRLVTTEKDMARLAGATGGALAQLRDKASAFAVTLEFENAGAVGEMIEAAALKVR